MMRILYIGTFAVLLGTAYQFAQGMGSDPLAPSRAWLETELAAVPKTVVLSAEEKSDFSQWQIAVARNPKVWDALTPPPPPPKPKAKVVRKPKKPDMKKLLKGVTAGTAQIGKKIPITIPGEKDKQWLEVGSVVNRCTLKSFNREMVVFELNWVKGKQIFKHRIPRK